MPVYLLICNSTLFEVLLLKPVPKWNFKEQIGCGGSAKVFRESITRPAFGTQLCAVKSLQKYDVRFPGEFYVREIEIFSKLKQVSTPVLSKRTSMVYIYGRVLVFQPIHILYIR